MIQFTVIFNSAVELIDKIKVVDRKQSVVKSLIHNFLSAVNVI